MSRWFMRIWFRRLLPQTAAGAGRAGRTEQGRGRRRQVRPQPEELEPRNLLATGTWTALKNLSPDPTGTNHMLLLSDGSVLVNGGGDAASNAWYTLTPDATGSYVKGTWTQVANSNVYRLFYTSDVLPDGRVLVLGGEYSDPNTDNTEDNTGEIYDPVKNTWTSIASFPQSTFGDGPSEVLADGTVLAGWNSGSETYIYNPTNNSWSSGPSLLHGDTSGEEGWVKLPDGSILTYNISGSPNDQGERFVPGATAAQDKWVDAGSVPVQLESDGGNSGIVPELGPGLLLPSGKVFWVGASGKTALYSPPALAGNQTGTWVAGPTIPGGLGAFDAPGAVMPNGKVLLGVSSVDGNNFSGPTQFYEYDPTANQLTAAPLPPSPFDNSGGVYPDGMLSLPSGQVLFSDSTDQLYVYTPSGSQLTADVPTVTRIANNGAHFTLTGTQLNGISEGSTYGDDAEEASNYPIVQLTNKTGTDSFARTSNWSSVGVQTGSTPVTTQFTLPGADGPGAYLLSVSANGLISQNVLFIEMGAGANNLTVQIDPNKTADVEVLQSGTLLAEYGLSSFDAIMVAGDSGSDALTVNFSNGNPLPGGGLDYAGNGGGSLTLYGGNFTTDSPTNPNQNAGTITLDSTTVTYSNLTSVTNDTNTADLEVSQTGPATITAGSNVTYTITVTNSSTSPSNAENVTVTDVAPAGMTLVSESALNNPDGFNNTSLGNSAVFTTGSSGSVAIGSSDTFQVVFALASSVTAASVSNTATITTNTHDSNPGAESATVSSTVTTVADLEVNKTGPATITTGTDVTYTITVTDKGPSDAQDVTLTDLAPNGMTLVPGSTTALSNPDHFSNTSSGTAASFTTGSLGSVASGSSDTFQVVFSLALSATASPLANTATLTTTTQDSNPGAESATVTSTVTTETDLEVSKTGPLTVTAGNTITYTITVTNKGAAEAEDVTLTDVAPAGTALVSETALNNPDGFRNTSSGNSAVFTTGSSGSVAAGSSDTFQVVLHLASSVTAASVSNTATITTTSTDTNPGAESATATSTVTTAADLEVSQTGPATITAGTNVTYTLTVTNKGGPSDAQGVSLTDVAPAGMTLVAESALTNPDHFSNTSSGTTASFKAGSVVSGSSDTFQVVFHLASNVTAAASPLGNTATLTTTTQDSNPGAESATATSTVTTAADLLVSQAAVGPVQEYGTLTLTLTLTNLGPSDAQSVDLTDVAPAGTTLLSATQTGGPDAFTNSSAGGTVNFSVATVTAGNTDTFRLLFQVGEDETTVNTATVTSTTTSPRPGDAASTLTLVIPESATAAAAAPLTAFENVSGTIQVATFTHGNGAEPAGNFTVQINWGDGSGLDTGTVVASGGRYLVEGIHSFSNLGQFQVQVSVFDDGVLVASTTSKATVLVPLPAGVPRTPLTGYVAHVFEDLFGLQADAGTLMSLSANNLFDIGVRRTVVQGLLRSGNLQTFLRVRMVEVLLRGILGHDPTTLEMANALEFLAGDHSHDALRDLTRLLLREMGQNVSLAAAEATMIDVCYQSFLGRLPTAQELKADLAALQPNAARSDEQELGMIVVSDDYFALTLTA
jgi:uncharacterized repeat protein (TIGR01451 family)